MRKATSLLLALVMVLTMLAGTAMAQEADTGAAMGNKDVYKRQPLSLLAAFVLKWSPAAVVLCLNADQLIKCIAGAVRVNRYRWIRRLTRPEG